MKLVTIIITVSLANKWEIQDWVPAIRPHIPILLIATLNVKLFLPCNSWALPGPGLLAHLTIRDQMELQFRNEIPSPSHDCLPRLSLGSKKTLYVQKQDVK